MGNGQWAIYTHVWSRRNFKIPLFKPRRRPLSNSRQTDRQTCKVHSWSWSLQPDVLLSYVLHSVTKSATFFPLPSCLLRHIHTGLWTVQPQWDWTKIVTMCNAFHQGYRLLVCPSTWIDWTNTVTFKPTCRDVITTWEKLAYMGRYSFTVLYGVNVKAQRRWTSEWWLHKI
jgi:hypothetical protein